MLYCETGRVPFPADAARAREHVAVCSRGPRRRAARTPNFSKPRASTSAIFFWFTKMMIGASKPLCSSSSSLFLHW